MEKEILNKLQWNMTVPTPYVFLVRFLKAASGDKEVMILELVISPMMVVSAWLSFFETSTKMQLEHMAYFFAELALMQYSVILYCPSMLAASAVYAALCTLKKSPLWSERLKRHTGFSEQQMLYVTFS